MKFLGFLRKLSQRAEEGHVKFVRGRIFSQEGDFSLSATVLRLSQTGAELAIGCRCILPENLVLELHLRNQILPQQHLCSLRWQHRNFLGVQFVERLQ